VETKGHVTRHLIYTPSARTSETHASHVHVYVKVEDTWPCRKVEKRGYTLGTLYQKEWGQLKHLFPRKAHGRCLRASTPDLYPQTLTSDSGSCLSSRSGLREVDNRSIRLTQPLRADGTASAATLPSLPSTEKPIARTCILPEGCGLEVRRAD